MNPIFVTPRKLCWMLLVWLIAACGEDSGLDDLFIPNVNNTWQSSRNSTFSLTSPSTDVNESDFTGNEFDDDGNFAELKGHYKNYYVEFTFLEGPDKDQLYKGNFIKGSDPLEMTVKGTTNNVTLHLKMND
jgi:hypothetical protein